jgi:hypothetical protein
MKDNAFPLAVRKDRMGPFERLEENGTSFSNTLVYDKQDLGDGLGGRLGD